jgi:hypothetical protein
VWSIDTDTGKDNAKGLGTEIFAKEEIYLNDVLLHGLSGSDDPDFKAPMSQICTQPGVW